MSPLNDPREALRRALQYDAGDPKRIQHLIKVYTFAEMIADGEHLCDGQRRVLLTAAALHDIGIHNVEEVCDLVARHHTYTGVDRLTLRILIEADFLVNAYEEGLSEEAVQVGREKLFTTATGKRLLQMLYAV